jgi:dipeptidase E
VLLDAAIGTGGPVAVAARDGLGGTERRKHSDDPSIGEDFVIWKPPTGSDETLGIVDFSIFPYLDNENIPDNSMANAEKWAAGMPQPAYLIDDQTAIKVIDGAVEVISEGHWKLFTP